VPGHSAQLPMEKEQTR